MFSDTPLLKPTLDAQREDKDGAVFYRLSDPTTGREYRLYEVEYLIAQMLDGRSRLSDIATRVRDELKFDLSPNDLERFVRELESLGFLSGTGKPVVKAGEPDAMALSADDIIEDGEVAEVDKMAVTDELDRLVRSALLHVKQGMIAQARDYFLAAKKYAPSDEKVGTMLNHLDVVGEDDGPSDIEYLWKQAVVLYPGLTQEIGPPGIGVAPIPIEEHRERAAFSPGRRWLVVGAFLVLVGGGFAFWVTIGRDLVRPVLVVDTDKVRVQRVHLYYDAEAIEMGPRETFAHAFEKAGVVVDVLVRPGEHVQKGQMLARQKLPPADEKQLAALRQKRQAAEKAYLAANLDVEKVQSEVTTKEEEVNKQKAEADELQKAIILKPANERAQSKKELAALKKSFATGKKDLAALKKKAAPSIKNLAKLKKTFDTAKAAEEVLVAKSPGAFLQATAEGAVTAISIEAGEKCEAGQPIVTVADTSALRMKFKGPDKRLQGLTVDTKVKLFYRDNELAEARVSERFAEGAIIETHDHEGVMAKTDRRAIKIVRETIENGLVVSAGAHIAADHAYVVEKDVAVRRPVEWIEVRGRDAIARSGLNPGEVVVTGPESILPQLNAERVEVAEPRRGVEGAQ